MLRFPTSKKPSAAPAVLILLTSFTTAFGQDGAEASAPGNFVIQPREAAIEETTAVGSAVGVAELNNAGLNAYRRGRYSEARAAYGRALRLIQDENKGE